LRKQTAVLVYPLAVLILAGCGSSSTTSSTTTSSTSTSAAKTGTSVAGLKVSSKSVSGLGAVLVNEEGKTLYVFAPDKKSKVTCQGECASIWPPLRLGGGQKGVGSGAVSSKLLGADPDPEGGQVLTYAGWPLYTYTADTSAGSASGQGLNVNGGYWYVISPSGKVIK